MALRIRQDAWQLTDDTLKWYGTAVERMQGLDPSDRRSWAYQSAMHGTYSDPALPLWNTCEHGTWYFVAWHRMYVYWFEEIVRSFVVEAGGPDTWALPYWNYTPAFGGNAVMPPDFRQTGSPLYVWERRVQPYNVNGGDPLPDVVTAIAKTLSTIPWSAPAGQPPTAGFFGQLTAPVHFNGGFGALEQQPHNAVHNALGGTYGWMADPNFAAQDPIFWLHHANIDRLWASWIALGGGRIDPPLSNWLTQTFAFFAPDGSQQSMACQQVEDTTALGYAYSDLVSLDHLRSVAPPTPAPEHVTGRAEIVGGSQQPVRLTGRRTAGWVSIDRKARESVLRTAGAEAPRKVFLSLDDIEARRNPGSVYAVYVNLPDDATEETAEDHLAGSLSFFGIEGSGRRADGSDHVHSYSAGYDITEIVQRLSATGDWDDESVRVTFHPAGVPLTEAEEDDPDLPVVTVGRISVHYL